MFVAIFGRPGCAFCLRAVQLAKSLEDRGAIEGHRYTDIQSEGITKDDLARTIGKPVHTVPQIFVDDSHVGGFTEFDRYVRDNDLMSATA
jgi:glutaredoxin 1